MLRVEKLVQSVTLSAGKSDTSPLRRAAACEEIYGQFIVTAYRDEFDVSCM
jgi:hypothetical protein